MLKKVQTILLFLSVLASTAWGSFVLSDLQAVEIKFKMNDIKYISENFKVPSASWHQIIENYVSHYLREFNSTKTSPPIEEIRAIMAQKVLWPPSTDILAALTTEDLEKGLRKIDPYARYVPPPSLPSAPALFLGIELFAHKSRLFIRSEPGGPAERTGVPEICELQAINGKEILNMGIAAVSALIDDALPKGQVVLSVVTRPGGKGKPYVVRPANFHSPSFTWKQIDDYFVIRIREFIAHDTAPGMAALYQTVIRSNTRVVIDLRGCSGGDLFEAIEIAGMFVSRGIPLLNTRDRAGVIKQYQSSIGQKLPSPTMLLIDYRTASAAEFLAGILQRYHLTRLVGEKSVGKFVSQTPVLLSNGGKLMVTTHAINIPDCVSYTTSGVKPDISYPNISVTKIKDIIYKISNGILVPH